MNNFITSQKGIELIKSFEGCYLKAYWDRWGKVYTIGYGHTGKDVFKGLKITHQQAENLLKQDVKRFENYVNNQKYVPLKLNHNQFDALVSFSFNMGQKNLKELVGKNSLSKIANDLLLYKYSGGKILRGLIRRREAEKRLFLNGDISIPNPPPSYSPKNVDNILSTDIGDFILHSNTKLEKTKEEFHFLIGDYNHNDFLDLYCIKNLGGDFPTEVHILDGKNKYKNWLLQTQTPLRGGEADWDFCLGDYNNDGNLDLICITKNKTGTNCTEVHILGGKSNFQDFILQTKTILHETRDNCQFSVGDFNGDGKLDIFYIAKNNTGSHTTEVHVLRGSDEYKSWLLQTKTILHETDDDWEFGVSNYVGKGNKDLYCINKRNENGQCTDVHILNGSNNYQSWSQQTKTKLHMTDENFSFYPVGKQLFVISRLGASDSTECHSLRV
jgi:GH24 family phage-related lysozyme (muramidase)